jgi:GT2 family glycosyltransferase
VSPTLSVLIVTWNSREDLSRTLPALAAELREGDELIVVDNGSWDGTPEAVRALTPSARFVANERNAGFASACNSAAALAENDLLVFLNPDAAPMAGWGEAIRRPLAERRGWAAWQSLVADHGGECINSAGNPVHFTGLVWAGAHGRPIEEAPPPGEVPALSGACLAIPRPDWEAAGGFPEHFFLYHEDVDLSLRLRLAGGTIGIEPAAVVDHEYEFGSRQHKWRMLERNRWAFLIRVYPGPLLALVFPALLATELALLGASLNAGWGRQKLGALLDVARWLPRLLRERRAVQAGRRIGAAAFASHLTAELDSPFIPAAARSGAASLALRGYWAAVRLLLGVRRVAASAGSASR